jgi:hypothetical protein
MDVRVIKIVGDEVFWTDEEMDIPLSRYEAAIQRMMVAMFDTPGTRVESPSFGGDIRKLEKVMRSRNIEEVKIIAADHIHQAYLSLKETEDYSDPFAIRGMVLRELHRRKPRGLSLTIEVHFEGATSTQIRVSNDVGE